nr:MAG TPA: hypothetical protein [Caudoviricetes sp.]
MYRRDPPPPPTTRGRRGFKPTHTTKYKDTRGR